MKIRTINEDETFLLLDDIIINVSDISNIRVTSRAPLFELKIELISSDQPIFVDDSDEASELWEWFKDVTF